MLKGHTWLYGLLCLLIGAPVCVATEAEGEPVALVESGRSRCVIVYPGDCALSARTAQKLSTYLREQTDIEVPLAADDVDSLDPATAIIVIDGTDDHRLARTLGSEAAFASDRQGAYRLQVARRGDGSPLILALGEGPQGAKYAVYRLMRELEINGRDAFIRPLDLQVQPFIETRSVALFNVWNMPIGLTRRHNIEAWSIEDIQRYIDQYDFYGFNAIESHDRFNDTYLEPLFGLKRAEWRAKVQQMSDFAHQNGQEFFLRIWGHVVMETPPAKTAPGPSQTVPKRLKELCPNNPVERKRWEEEIRDYYVQHYAGRIDHLIGHWCDPGICRENGCTFRTPMQLQMELHNAFKARDPGFDSTFSLWFFDVTAESKAGWARGGWAEYESDLDLINAGILDKDVTIAAYTFRPDSYRNELVEAIVAAGHRPAVWTWYRADHEIRPSLHIHLRERLGKYFDDLPASVQQLDWHNIERNVHGAANTANYYIAGRLMWEPELDIDDLLTEFLTFTFGADNAAKVAPAYQAIEHIRCHSCVENWERLHVTGAGSDDPKADVAMARSALDALSQVEIDPAFRPRVPLDLSPEQILANLRESLEVTHDFAQLRAGELPAIEATIADADHVEVKKRIQALRTKQQAWFATLAGRQEAILLNQQIKRLDQQLNALPEK